MPGLYEQEDAEVARTMERSTYAFIAGGLATLGGFVTLALAPPRTHRRHVHAIGGGYTAITIGVTVGVIGWGAARGHARIMAREQRHYLRLAEMLGDTRQSIGLAVTDEVAQHRNGT